MYAVDERTMPTRLDPEALDPVVEQARGGDVDAFETIVRTLQGPMRSFARRMMRDRGLGDDAAQEIFFRIWRGLPRYESSGRFVAWSFTIARNTCIELLRKEVRVPTPVEEIPAATTDPHEEAELRRVVREAVDALDEPYRSTFLLRESGLTYDEVAEAAGCPLGTVRSRLHEARRVLADRLAPYLFGGEEDAR